MKIAPGVKLNINKGSVGVSLGVRGAKVSINSKGDRHSTIGLPGSGLSYTKRTTSQSRKASTEKTEVNNSLHSMSQGIGSKQTRIYLMTNMNHLHELDFETKSDRIKLLQDKELTSIYRWEVLKTFLLKFPITVYLGCALFQAIGWYPLIWIGICSLYVMIFGLRNKSMKNSLRRFQKIHKLSVNTKVNEKENEFEKAFKGIDLKVIERLMSESPYVQFHIITTMYDDFLSYGLKSKEHAEAAFRFIETQVEPSESLALALEFGLHEDVKYLVAYCMLEAKKGSMVAANEYLKPLCSSRKKILAEDKHVSMYFYALCLEEAEYFDLALSELKKVKRKYPGFMDTDEKIEKLNKIKKAG